MSIFKIIQKPFPYQFYNITLYLVIINLLVYLLTSLYQPLITLLAVNPVLITRGYVWTFISYMFVHGSIGHILFNMITLYIFGSHIEQEMGSWEFLMFYLLVGLLAGVFSFIVYSLLGISSVFLIGASGAIYGVMLAFALYYPNARIFVFGLIPVRSFTLVIVFAALAIFNQITGFGGGVAHITHLAGFLFAFLYFPIRLAENPIKRLRGYF